MKKSASLAAAAFFAIALPATASAQQAEPEAEGAFDISATVTAVSDYRFRGVSLSGRDPALQGSLDVSVSGFYAGVWASTIERYADSEVETDLYAGYAGSVGDVEFDIGAIAYFYPGGDGTGNVYEATASVAYVMGPAKLRFSGGYAPDQKNLVGDNLYLSVDGEFAVPRTPLTLTAQVGRERGSFYGRKYDWSLGAQLEKGPFTLGLSYVDSDLDPVASGLGRNARGGVLASLSATF
jgi:uncharacterized protein (TIGR02001 family)